MSARNLTRDPEGNLVAFSTKRGKPDYCSKTCNGVYSLRGELRCKYFGNIVGRRDKECIENEERG